MVQVEEDDDHKEQHEVHQHEAGLGEVDGAGEGVEAVVVDDGEEGRGCQGGGGLEAAQEGVHTADVSLRHSLREQRPNNCGHLMQFWVDYGLYSMYW